MPAPFPLAGAPAAPVRPVRLDGQEHCVWPPRARVQPSAWEPAQGPSALRRPGLLPALQKLEAEPDRVRQPAPGAQAPALGPGGPSGQGRPRFPRRCLRRGTPDQVCATSPWSSPALDAPAYSRVSAKAVAAG